MPQNDIFIVSVVLLLLGLGTATKSTTLQLAFILAFFYAVGLVIYRLFFHPLAHFPGPKFAAATYLYEFKYDILTEPGGQYVFKLEELHKKYGPVLRISPDEIQINDPEYFDKVYVSGAEKRHRWDRAGTGATSPGSMSAAHSHDLHRMRKSTLQNFFSKAAIGRAEDRLQRIIAKLRRKLEAAAGTGEVVNISEEAARLTISFMTEYVFGRTWDEDADTLLGAIKEGFESLSFFKFFPVLHSIPRSIVEKMAPVAKVMTMWENKCITESARVKTDLAKGQTFNQLTVASEVLGSDIPESEKDVRRMAQETQILVIAGTETTARTLAAAVYWILNDQEMLKKLRTELDEAIPDASLPISLPDVERLPYLNAVLKEAHRTLALGLNRSLLIADTPLQYGQWTMPPGTPVCVSLRALLHDKTAYPTPTTFDPERWTTDDAVALQLRNKYFQPFARGHRNCIGQNLAWSELCLGLATIFRCFELSLFDVDFARDIEVVRDCFVGFPTKESRGVRVQVVGKRT